MNRKGTSCSVRPDGESQGSAAPSSPGVGESYHRSAAFARIKFRNLGKLSDAGAILLRGDWIAALRSLGWSSLQWADGVHRSTEFSPAWKKCEVADRGAPRASYLRTVFFFFATTGRRSEAIRSCSSRSCWCSCSRVRSAVASARCSDMSRAARSPSRR